ncbi:Scr1 family TA system antitoxin-like transcriptional regulator [Streptomyces sp. NPDC059740]|uniref:helix-turn-helix domain-containing protein n=1 Tax=Streptomyces sp. NPDC059740 TaxID=3346926 RepID=UPI00365F017E
MAARQAGQGQGNSDRPSIWIGYGKLVRLFRDRAGLSRQQLADKVGYSCETVASIEQGRRPAKAAFTQAAERVLEAAGTLSALQREVDHAKLPQFFQDFALVETEALSRASFDPLLVPGLLQTEDYSREVFNGHCPQLDAETLDQRLEGRIGRQSLLTRTPTAELSFIIGEAALRNPLGGRATMLEQLEHILATARQRHVQVQVMPTVSGFHQGLNGPMVLVVTATHDHVAYFESQGVGTLVTEVPKVSAFELRYGKLRSQALSTDESARFIERLTGEL